MSDKYSAIKTRAKDLHQKTEAARDSKSYRRVVGVLSGLGFLIAPDVTPLPKSKVSIEDAILVGQNIEPRILEVLPAAIYSFPKSFLHLDRAPMDLSNVILALKTGKSGPDFEGISFAKLLEAAERPIKNKRRKSVSERRISKTYRLSPTSIGILKRRSRERGMNSTQYLEGLILGVG